MAQLFFDNFRLVHFASIGANCNEFEGEIRSGKANVRQFSPNSKCQKKMEIVGSRRRFTNFGGKNIQHNEGRIDLIFAGIFEEFTKLL